MHARRVQRVGGTLRYPDFALPEPYVRGRALAQHDNRVVFAASAGARAVVFKCLLAPASAPDEDSFRQEFLGLEALSHPNWVQPLRFGSLPRGAGLYMILDEAEGISLQSCSGIGWGSTAAQIAHGILSALDALHRTGLAHLDLKPEQIVVGGEGVGASRDVAAPGPRSTERLSVHVLDLGLAVPLGKKTDPRGTAGFLAPELLRGEVWDERADLYAFGAVLHELVAGHPAFSGSTSGEILRNQLAGFDATELLALGTLPPDVVELIRELLSCDPRWRPRTARAVWMRLRELMIWDSASRPPGLNGSHGTSFVGREPEIARFTEWIGVGSGRFQPVAESSTVTCRITGEPGIGKTRLLERLRAVAQTCGWEVETRETSAGPDWVLGRGRNRLLLQEVASEGIWIQRETEPTAASTELLLHLGPMSSEDLNRIAAGWGLESKRLAQRLVDDSFGNPSLLVAALTQVTPEMDLAGRIEEDMRGSDDADAWIPEELPLPRTPITGSWERIANALFAGADERTATALADASIALDGVSTHPIASPSRAFAAAADRGLVAMTDDGRVVIPSQTLRRAIRFVRPDVSVAVLRSTVQQVMAGNDHDDPSRLDHLLRTELEFGELTPGLLDAAVGSWLAQGFPEKAVKAYATAVCARFEAHPEDLALSEATLEELAAVTSETIRMGSRLPDGFLESGPGGGRTDRQRISARLIQVAALREAGRSREALDLLKGEPPTSGELHRMTWLQQRYQLEWALEGGSKTIAELDPELFSASRCRASVCLSVLNLEGRDRGLAWWQPRLAGLERIVEDTPAHIRTWYSATRGAFMLDVDPVQARNALLRSADLARTYSLTAHRTNSLQNLAALAYDEGDLRKAETFALRVLLDRAARGRHGGVVSGLGNLAVLYTMTGKLGRALRALREGEAVLSQHPVHASVRISFADQESLVLLRLGRVSESLRIARKSMVDVPIDDVARFEAHTGEALLRSGSLDEGRRLLTTAIKRAESLSLYEDATEHLVAWLFAEIDHGDASAAVQVYSDYVARRDHAARPTRVLGELARCEMTALEWLAPDPLLDEALQGAGSDIGACELHYYAWRVHWHLARLVRSGHDLASSATHMETARRMLLELAQTFEDASDEDLYLSMATPQRFLDDLQGITGA